MSKSEPLTPDDAYCLRMLARAVFLDADVTLPSGRRVQSPEEMRELTRQAFEQLEEEQE